MMYNYFMVETLTQFCFWKIVEVSMKSFHV